VILVGQRRPEEGHDPVAHHLIDGALVVVNGLHHVSKNGIENLARLLGVTVGEQLHRALEVGEEHGDLFTLAFEGALGREDLLGEMLRSVRLRGGADEWSRAGGTYGLAALLAELRAELIGRATGGARHI